MPSVTVNVTIVDVFVGSSQNRPLCDTMYRRTVPGSFEAIRLFKACYIELSADSKISDSNGKVSFDGIKLKRGIEGRYSYKYVTSNGVSTSSYATYLESDSGLLTILTPPVFSAEYGIPMSSQPRILVTTATGIPISGKYVVAVATPEWGFGRDPVGHNMQGITYNKVNLLANRFAMLSGEVSLPTDSNGIAVFTNLTIFFLF